jgi:hypothetical protein
MPVIQAQIAFRLIQHLKKRQQGPPTIFVSVNVALTLGYLVATILWMVNLCLKLQFVSRFRRIDASGSLLCANGYIPYPRSRELCQKANSAAALRVTETLDWITTAIFQVMLVLADSLLVRRLL